MPKTAKTARMSNALLSGPLKRAVANDEISVTETIIALINEQLKMDEHINTIINDVKQGKYSVFDADFWQRIHE